MPSPFFDDYSAELLFYERFFKTSMFRRISDLKRLWNRSDITELPRGCMLHLIDDNFLMTKPPVLVPDVNSWAMQLHPDRKYVHHVLTPPAATMLPLKETFRLPNTGLATTVMNFKKCNQRMMRPVNQLTDFPSELRGEVQSIISYNALYRARILGMLRQHRRFEYIFTNIFNTIAAVGTTRKHFIPIPVGDRVFDRSKFMTSFEKYAKGSIKLPEDPWYLFVMHLLGFVNTKTTPSLFEQIPPAYWDGINFILYTRNKVLILNLKLLKELNVNNSILWRVLNLLNLIAEDGRTAAIADYSDAPVVYDTTEDPTELVVTTDTPFEGEAPTPSSPTERKVEPVKPEPPVEVKPSKVVTVAPEATPKTKEPVFKSTFTANPSMFTRTTPTNIGVRTKEKLAVQQQEFEKYLAIEPEQIQVDPKWLELESETGTTNSPKFTGNISKTEQQQLNKAFIQNVDAQAKRKIAADASLTEAQAHHAETVAQQYKTLKLNGRTLQELIETVPDDQVATNTLEFLKDDPEILDKSMLKSSVGTFEQDYMKKMFDRDLAMELTAFNKQGMFLKELQTTDVSDSLNQLMEYRCVYEDTQKKTHTIKFKLPKVDDRGYCLVNGTLAIVKKQRLPLPICKLSSDRVSLTSDFNKYLVTRNTNVAHSFVNYIEAILEKVPNQVVVQYGSHKWDDLTLPYEYTRLATKYQVIQLAGKSAIKCCFDYEHRHQWMMDNLQLTAADLESIKTTEEETKSIAFAGVNSRQIAYIDINNEIVIKSLDNDSAASPTTLIDLFCSTLEVTPPPLSEWVDIDITSTKVPVIFCLCYRYGLSAMLNYTNTKFRVVNPRERVHRLWSDVVIKFADKTLIIPRTPFVNSLLFSGLNFFKLDTIELEELDSKDIYYDLLQSKRKSVHYLKAVDAFFDFFIDPICREVLTQMQEPTDPRDLLIRATQLLATDTHNHQASSANFRFRSYERMVSAVYKHLSKSFNAYRSKSVGAGHRWSIQDFEIQQEIMQDQLKENVDLINPINDIKYLGEFSHGGIAGGRKGIDTFNIDDRRYTEDSVGVVSEATVDSAKTGYAASMPMDPTIQNMRGMTLSAPPEALEPTQLLSVSALVMPGITQDDSKRQNFVSIHLSHYLPTEKCEVSRLRTGYEKVIAHRSKPPFAYAAEQDGVIEAIDPTTQMLRIKYPDKTVAVAYGDEYTKNGGGGFYCTQNVVINNFKVGDKVKRGDIVTYNDRFFTPDPYSKQVYWNIGVLEDVVLIDNDSTLEDSSIIDKQLAEALKFNPVHIRDIVLDKKTTIHRYAAIGTTLTSVDPLMIFDQSELNSDMFGGLDEDAIELLGQVNQRTPKAKFTGKVVAIDVFYIGSIQDMSPSVRGLTNLVNKAKAAKRQAAAGTANQANYPGVQSIQQSNRIGLTDLDDTNIIFRFYIQQDMGMHGGDKVEFDSSLKSVCAGVSEYPWESEDGTITAHALFSSIGIDNRIINSPKIEGMCNKILDTAEKQILKMYFEE